MKRVKVDDGVEEERKKELIQAAALGDAEKVKELILNGADAHCWVDRWMTPLALGCFYGRLDVVRVILDHGEKNEDQVVRGFRQAVVKGHLDVVKLMLERGADPSAHECRAFCQASEYGQGDIVRLLLNDPRVNPAAQDNASIRWAAVNGHSEVLALLLNDPRVDPAGALCEAARVGQCETLKMLLADGRVDGTHAIHSADPPAVPILLEDERCGIRVNRALFEQHHAEEVARYDELAEDRTERIAAVFWCMKQIGDGWGDLCAPTEVRMQRLPLDWEEVIPSLTGLL